MEIVKTCPLGHICERAVNGKIERCVWFVQIQGRHPQTGKDVNESDCAIAWMPVLSLEMARTNRGQTAAIESFRNEMMEDNQELGKMLLTGVRNAETLPSQ